MSLPTLFRKGHLRSVTGDPEDQKILDNIVPIDYIIEWFHHRIGQVGMVNKVLILKSMTASGKSIALPSELYRKFVHGKQNAKGIICTQPRILTAIENVHEILKNYSKILRLGDTIGWATKGNKSLMKSTGILSATVGTLMQKLRVMTDAEMMGKYQFIMVDEVHERDLQTDMTIYMLKNFLLRNADNPNCPFVVLMSATFEHGKFLQYFGVPLATNFIHCEGAAAGFDEMWEWNGGRTVSDYTRAAADVVKKILDENDGDDPARGDILIFMPGSAEFMRIRQWLTPLNEEQVHNGRQPFLLLEIDSQSVKGQNADYRNLTKPHSELPMVEVDGVEYTAKRRVIIATNVAETGLTLWGLKYVIDSGYSREMEYNPIYGVRGLLTKPAPKSRIVQRRGRAGRKFRGTFYPLYPKYIFDRLPENQYPHILTENIDPIMVQIVHEQMRSKQLMHLGGGFLVNDIDMLDPPTQDSIHSSLEKLYAIGFISPRGESGQADGYSLTKLGSLANGISLPPDMVRMIFAAYNWGCSVLDMVTISAYLLMDRSMSLSQDGMNWANVYKDGLPPFFVTAGVIYKIRLLIADEFIDGVILYNAIKYAVSGETPKESMKNLHDWCNTNMISTAAVFEFLKLREDIIEQMLVAEMDVFCNEEMSIKNTSVDTFMDVITRIKYSIYDGYRQNILHKTDDGKYKSVMGLVVEPPELFKDNEIKKAEEQKYGWITKVLPNVVIAHEFVLKQNKLTTIYTVKSTKISTCDGFVNTDCLFLA